MTDFTFSRRQALAAASSLALLGAFASPALARAVPANLTPQDETDLKRIQDYLNGITTMRAKFQQYSEKGGIAFGTIYLKRPGFIRIEYEPPSPMLIVSDSVSLHYYDPELDQINRVPVSSSPLWFLLLVFTTWLAATPGDVARRTRLGLGPCGGMRCAQPLQLVRRGHRAREDLQAVAQADVADRDGGRAVVHGANCRRDLW